MSDLFALSASDDRIVENADWVELATLLAADGNTSQDDFARAHHRARGRVRQDRSREHAHDVFHELADRLSSCGDQAETGYPFTMSDDDMLLSRVSDHAHSRYRIYKFLLLVTRAGMGAKDRTQAGIDATKVFERLCADVLCAFWGTNGHCGTKILGTASEDRSDDGFEGEINKLCRSLCEGGGWKKGARKPGGGDGGLDIAVWRRFADKREGALVGFAQCKTGDYWRKNRTQLQPRAFCSEYMTDSLILDPIRIYMVPHRVSNVRWASDTRLAGLIVDRCRIVEYSTSISKKNLDDSKKWMTAVLNTAQDAS